MKDIHICMTAITLTQRTFLISLNRPMGGKQKVTCAQLSTSYTLFWKTERIP